MLCWRKPLHLKLNLTQLFAFLSWINNSVTIKTSLLMVYPHMLFDIYQVCTTSIHNHYTAFCGLDIYFPSWLWRTSHQGKFSWENKVTLLTLIRGETPKGPHSTLLLIPTEFNHKLFSKIPLDFSGISIWRTIAGSGLCIKHIYLIVIGM